MNVLAADIGGTKSLLALATEVSGSWQFEYRTRFPSRDFPGLESIIEQWLHSVPPDRLPLSGIGLAVAGPVQSPGRNGRSRVTNLTWEPLSAQELTRRFHTPVTLINDFAAIGTCLPALAGEDTLLLQPGTEDPAGLRLVLGAGTGLGTCLVGPAPGFAVFPGEGGHADFAPANAWEAGLAAWTRARFARCTREHLLSGPGIARIAAFIAETGECSVPTELLQDPDPAAAIGAAASRGDPAALRIVERFVRIYAGQAGDLALTALPTGGIYLAGGIAPRWSGFFREPAFVEAFRDKPPMRDLLAGLAVRLVTHPEPGLLGAAVAALRDTESAGDPS